MFFCIDAVRALRAPPRRLRLPIAKTLLALLCLGLAFAATQELGYSRSVTPGLVKRYAVKFGPQAASRLAAWQEFVHATGTLRRVLGDNLATLRRVNSFFNRIPFIDDRTHWHAEDYWATPAESVASNGADCEDFSIAKYFALKELGVPIQRLRITYVKAVRLNQAHMVLAYYPEPNAVPLILDNLENEVRPASERNDLVPVYSFNDEDVLIARKDGQSTSAGSSLQIRLWRGLLEKLEAELHY